MKKNIILFAMFCALLTGMTAYAQVKEDNSQDWIEKFYFIKTGNLWFNSLRFDFPDITNTRISTDTMPVYNAWGQSMDLSFSDLPEYITARIIPSTLKPKEEGKIILTFDPVKKGVYGPVYENLWLYTTDTNQAQKRLIINPNIAEDFSVLTEQQLADAPHIKFDQEAYIFDTITSGSNVVYDFVFTNEGKSDLIIRNVKAGCGCTATNPEKTLLKPGENSKIGIVFNTSGRTGHQLKSVTVIANDPKKPVTMLNIEGFVKP
ncbi:MAG TPA: DUF1573 domain-containing protein [Bacteroidales bacterium]|nr:DUF1573 domain-containing protein [Bacteroidales bacterium]